MRRLVILSLVGGLAAAPAYAQQWQTQSDAETDMTAAIVVWSSGHALVARCQTSYFEVFLRLPEVIDASQQGELVFEGQSRRLGLQPQIGRQRTDLLFVTEPGRAGRWLSGGGQLTVEAPGVEPVALPLPSNSGLVHEIMANCDTPLEDARDLLPRLPSGPSWARRPEPSYPDRALRDGVMRGTVSLTCVTQDNGSLADCIVEREDPVGVGFGREALRAASRARMSPAEDGTMAGSTVSFSIRFQLAN